MIGGDNAHHRCLVLFQGDQADSANAGDTCCGAAVPAVFLHPERRGIYRSAWSRGVTVPTDPVSRLSKNAGHEQLERAKWRVERPAARWGCSNGEEREANHDPVRRAVSKGGRAVPLPPPVVPFCPPDAGFPPFGVLGLFAPGRGPIFRPFVRFPLPFTSHVPPPRGGGKSEEDP